MATTVGHPEDCMRPEMGNNVNFIIVYGGNIQYQIRVREGLSILAYNA